MTNKMYLMTGRPGAGKTEFVEKWIKENCDDAFTPAVFCPDDYYAKMNGDELIHKNSFDVWVAMYKDINKAMCQGRDVIIDTNSPTETMREQFIDWFPNFGKYVLIYIYTGYQTCDMNNKSRRRVIPQEKFNHLFYSYKTPLDDRSLKRWDEVWCYTNNGNKQHLREVLLPKEQTYKMWWR